MMRRGKRNVFEKCNSLKGIGLPSIVLNNGTLRKVGVEMENYKEEIAVFIEKNKKNSKLNKSEVAEVLLIFEELLSKGDLFVKNVVHTLISLHYSLTEEFFQTVFLTLDAQQKNNLIVEFMRDNKILKNHAQFGLNRTLVVINALLETEGHDELIHSLLKFGAKKAYGKDCYQKAAELLRKICFSKTKEKLLLLDFSSWNETELINLSDWVQNAITEQTEATIVEAFDFFAKRNNLPERKQSNAVYVHIGQPAQKPYSFGAEAKEHTKHGGHQKEKLLDLVSRIEFEAKSLINEEIRLKKEIEEIKNQLVQTKKEKEDLTLKLSEERDKNDKLVSQLRKKQIDLSHAENKISEIEDRLINSFNADKIQQQQELMLLRHSLEKALKHEHEDFCLLAQKEPSPQYYNALLGVIENIFDTLRRNGIVLKKEEG